MSDAPEPDPGAETRRALNLLGIALRGGRLEVGTEAVKEAARAGDVEAAVLAADAGENARDRVVPLLRAAGVPTAEAADGRSLGRALGRERVVVAGVTDPGLARQVMEALGERSPPESRAAEAGDDRGEAPDPDGR